MAVAYDTTSPSSAGTSVTGATSISWSHTCSGSNRLLTVAAIVSKAFSGTLQFYTTATYNGNPMTSAGRVYSNHQDAGYVELFYLVAPDAGTGTVQVTANSSLDIIGGSVSFTGVDQTNPISNITSNFGSSAAATLSVASDYNNMVVTAVCCGSGITSSDKDQRWLLNLNTSTGAGNGSQSTAVGQGTVTTTYAVTSDWWGMIGFNINATPITVHPKLVSVTTAGTYSTSGTPRTATITSQPGDYIVVYGGGDDGSDVLTTPTGNGIVFTLQQSVATSNFASAFLWTGLDTTGGTWTMRSTDPNNGKWAFTCFVFRNAGGFGNSNAAHSATGLPTVSLTTTRDNSAIVVFSDDWQALDGSTRAWQTVNGITPTPANLMEINYERLASAYTVYGAYYPDAGTAGAKTLGLSTAPSGQSYSIVAAEILPPQVMTAGIGWFVEPVAPSLRDASYDTKNATGSNSLVIPYTTQPGDFMVVIVSQTSNAATLFSSSSPGWTKQGEQRAGTAADTIAVFTKVAASGDAGTTMSVDSVNTENFTMQLRVYANVDQTTPLDITPVFGQSGAAATTGWAPQVTTVTPYSTIVTAYSVPTSTGTEYHATDWTDPTGFQNDLQTCSTNSTNNAALASYDQVAVNPATYGAFQAGIPESRFWATVTLVLRHS